MRDAGDTDLSICIVNWNCADLLRQSVESILKHSEGLQLQIIVVDNASSDNSADMIAREFPLVTLIRNSVNRGFGRANNQAIGISRGRFILLLNPDVVMMRPCFREMVGYLETHRDVGCVGCKLINRDGSVQQTAYPYFPTPWTELREGMLLNRIARNVTRRDGAEAGPVLVAWLVGASMMFRREVLTKSKGFDEQYFMYGEDVDLCYRLHQSGYKVCYLMAVEMFHYHGASSGKKVKRYFSTLMQRDSVYRFMKTNYGTYDANLYRVLCIISSLFRLVLIAPAMLLSVLLKQPQRVRIFSVFEKYAKVVSWGMGLESWTRRQVPE